MTDPEQILPAEITDEQRPRFTITKITHHNSLGEEVTREESRKEWNAFQTLLEEQYNARVSEIVKEAVESSPSDKWGQVKKIFEYLVDNVKYEHNIQFTELGYVVLPKYQYHNEWGFDGGSKYAPLLEGKGVCAGFVPAIDDLLSRIGVESHEITGQTRVVDAERGIRAQHGWNVVNVDGEWRHLDLTYALYNHEKSLDPFEYFLITDDELKRVGPHSGYDEQLAAIMGNNKRGQAMSEFVTPELTNEQMSEEFRLQGEELLESWSLEAGRIFDDPEDRINLDLMQRLVGVTARYLQPEDVDYLKEQFTRLSYNNDVTQLYMHEYVFGQLLDAGHDPDEVYGEAGLLFEEGENDEV